MKVLTWNLNNRRQASPDQADFVTHREPDIVTLTEVHPSQIDLWRKALKGYDVVQTTSVSQRPRTVLLAAKGQKLRSRTPIKGHVIRADVNGLKLVAAHVPNASNHGPLRKMRVLRYLALQRGDPIIVAGDLNCPKVELTESRHGRSDSMASVLRDDAMWECSWSAGIKFPRVPHWRASIFPRGQIAAGA